MEKSANEVSELLKTLNRNVNDIDKLLECDEIDMSVSIQITTHLYSERTVLSLYHHYAREYLLYSLSKYLPTHCNLHISPELLK